MKPFLRNSETGEVCPAALRALDFSDLGDILALQLDVMDQLGDKSLYIPGEPAAFESALGSGEIWGCFTGRELAGLICIEPAAAAAEPLDFSAAELEQTAQFTRLLVAPRFRANALGLALQQHALARAVGPLGYRYAAADASPKNPAAVLTLLRPGGLRIVALAQRHGCKLRYVACYDRDDTRLFREYERIPSSDVYAVSKRLAFGYEVFAFHREHGQIFLWLGA